MDNEYNEYNEKNEMELIFHFGNGEMGSVKLDIVPDDEGESEVSRFLSELFNCIRENDTPQEGGENGN